MRMQFICEGSATLSKVNVTEELTQETAVYVGKSCCRQVARLPVWIYRLAVKRKGLDLRLAEEETLPSRGACRETVVSHC